MKGKMAIIGDGDGVTVFSSVGIVPFPVKGAEEAASTLKKLAKEYRIIFVTDDIAEQIDETIKKYVSASYPIVLSVPSGKGSNGYGTAVLKDAMEKALGVDILFNVKDKEGNK